MKKLMIPIVLAFLLILGGCGGGGGTTLPPAQRDLSGLEGTWVLGATYSGLFDTPDGKIQLSDSLTGTWFFEKNAVLGSNYQPLAWSYNGSVLTIQNAIAMNDYDYDCGDMLLTGQATFNISLTPGATFGNITGSADMTIQTAYCGNATGKINYSGTLSKV
jgi:hypothetical protein